MWALLLLQKYDTERGNAAMVGTSEKTFLKWSWHVIDEIADGISPIIVSVMVMFVYKNIFKKLIILLIQCLFHFILC